MMNSITDEGINKLLKDAHLAHSYAKNSTSAKDQVACSTLSLAATNLIIAEMMVRHENERNCKA